ncbi:MAG: helix-turn-helix transcriptional regulator [Blautia sp.]
MEDNRFKKLRMEKNPNEMEDFKVKELAKELGIAAPKISELENNRRRASLSELQAYHKYFNVPYEYLLGENNSRYYENMVTSKELGLSGEAIKTIQELTQNKTYARLLNIIIEKYISALLFEVSNGTAYMDLFNTRYIGGYNKDAAIAFEKNLERANNEGIDALQKITDSTGQILRLISGNQNIDYCQMRAGLIIQEAVGKILYEWKSEKNEG